MQAQLGAKCGALALRDGLSVEGCNLGQVGLIEPLHQPRQCGLVPQTLTHISLQNMLRLARGRGGCTRVPRKRKSRWSLVCVCARARVRVHVHVWVCGCVGVIRSLEVRWPMVHCVIHLSLSCQVMQVKQNALLVKGPVHCKLPQISEPSHETRHYGKQEAWI